MKHDWEYQALEQIATIEYGTRVVQKIDGGSIYPVYGGGGATFKMDRYNRENRMVIARFAISKQCTRYVYGKFFLNDSGLTVSSNVENLSQTYLDRCLMAYNDKIYSLGKGAAQKNLEMKAFAKLQIPLPPLPTQQSIVSELDSLSKIIADCKETLKDYDALEQSIFYDMFGDPVKNEKGWEVKKLGEVCSKITDGVHSKPKYVESGVPFVSVKDITTGELIMDDVKYISKEDHIQYSKRCPIEFGDVLYTKVGATYGRPALVNVKDEFSLYVSVALLKPIHKVVNNQFLCKQLSTDFVKRQADSSIKGIGVPDLHLNMIKNFVVLVPPMHLQLSFNEKIEAIEQMKEETKKALQETETLFQARMDYWFN